MIVIAIVIAIVVVITIVIMVVIMVMIMVVILRWTFEAQDEPDGPDQGRVGLCVFACVKVRPRARACVFVRVFVCVSAPAAARTR